jgi:hypothetical protein
MMLFANICLTAFVLGIVHLSIATFAFHNDFKQIQYQDSLCIIRAYLSYVSCALHAYSYLLSANYQYILIVYPNRIFWQSKSIQFLLIILAWTLAFVFPFPYLITGEFIYNDDNQLCQAPYRLSFSVFYLANFTYIFPMTSVLFIYFKLVRYVKNMSKNLTSAATLLRAQRDFTVVRRIVILVHMLLAAGVPMITCVFLSFVNRAPKYDYRIGYIFIYVSVLLVIIALFQFTDLLKASVKNLLFDRRNTVLPAGTIKLNVTEKKKDEILA